MTRWINISASTVSFLKQLPVWRGRKHVEKNKILVIRTCGMSVRQMAKIINRSKIVIHHFLADTRKHGENNRVYRPLKLTAFFFFKFVFGPFKFVFGSTNKLNEEGRYKKDLADSSARQVTLKRPTTPTTIRNSLSQAESMLNSKVNPSFYYATFIPD